MQATSIEWTDFTANPLKFRDAAGKVVWGCVHASPGCQHCYAETLAKRYGRGGPFNVPTMNGLRPFLDERELHKMLTYKPASGKRCFVGDMTDIFGPWVPDELLDRLFAVFALRPDVTWQVLTKRADRMREYITTAGESDDITVEACELAGQEFDFFRSERPLFPFPNVWLGVSVEDQQRADERIPLLLNTPAAVRFISAEPLLGGIDIAKHRPGALGLNWCIVGGESGPGARTCEAWWIRNIIGQCRDADVPVFVKQLGSRLTFDETREHGDWLFTQIKNRKGGDPSEWPEDLRVRAFPEPPA